MPSSQQHLEDFGSDIIVPLHYVCSRILSFPSLTPNYTRMAEVGNDAAYRAQLIDFLSHHLERQRRRQVIEFLNTFFVRQRLGGLGFTKGQISTLWGDDSFFCKCNNPLDKIQMLMNE